MDRVFFFQAEDGIRDLVRSRGLGDVYKRQGYFCAAAKIRDFSEQGKSRFVFLLFEVIVECRICLLYTSDAADDLLCVDLGGRRIIKKKNMMSIYNLTPSTNT